MESAPFTALHNSPARICFNILLYCHITATRPNLVIKLLFLNLLPMELSLLSGPNYYFRIMAMSGGIPWQNRRAHMGLSLSIKFFLHGGPSNEFNCWALIAIILFFSHYWSPILENKLFYSYLVTWSYYGVHLLHRKYSALLAWYGFIQIALKLISSIERYSESWIKGLIVSLFQLRS